MSEQKQGPKETPPPPPEFSISPIVGLFLSGMENLKLAIRGPEKKKKPKQ
ncbi:MAG: hypothetical protein ISN26_06105 [Betaproteobacteria bacterium AqS2]|uniref:Uncharacterized protein n=1 Tax=Candidatus Amphirhobacter heronislandensis TaxID=1732024 RepID=A0A930UCZ0_9GAMM|nr:hypothetical protein [Betaproteobacteria bacterium AqS2]